jgi:hypothetical protein
VNGAAERYFELSMAGGERFSQRHLANWRWIFGGELAFCARIGLETSRKQAESKTMKKTRGRFYFKRTSNGNLIGEFSNNNAPGAYTESADLAQPNEGNIVGIYKSTWQENGNPYCTDLAISNRPNSNGLFRLEWRGSANFDGEGMLCDDILIGDYHAV